MADKDEELEYVRSFATEYEFVTGTSLRVLAVTERPDFVVTTSPGGEVRGLEVVQVVVDPESRMWRTILYKDEFMDPLDTMIRLQELVYRKDEKRRSPGWQHAGDTILLLALLDAPVAEAAKHFDAEVIEELRETGFTEIWIADNTLQEAYNTVQLYCLKGPTQYHGLHQPHPVSWKPFG